MLAAALGAAAAGTGRAEDAADLVLRGGRVYTLDPRRPKPQAIAVTGSRIVAVGRDDEIARRIGPRTEVLELAGATVVPGLTEGHAHLLGLGRQELTLDLQGAASWGEVVARVAKAVNERRPGEWIVGRGWNESKWKTPAARSVRGFPTHHELSAAVPANPVRLERADGHAVIVNAAAMKAAGLGSETHAPAGGEIIHDAEGQPTGVLVDNAESLVPPPPLTHEERRRALELALRRCLAHGLTSFHDAGAEPETLAILRDFAAQGRLGPRLHVMLSGPQMLRASSRPEVDLGGGMLTIRTVKLYADGALGSRGAALLAPYADDPRNSGFFTTPPEAILDAARYALGHGFQLAVHAIGDRANRMVLDAYEKAFAERPEVKDPRFRIEHAQHLDPADIPRFARLGVIAAMQGIHATSDRPWAPARLGLARVRAGAYVWQKLLVTGAHVVNGTDAPVEDVDPIRCFYASLTRQDESGQPPGGFDPEQRMTREEALRSYTLEPAYAAFEENARGTIEPGKLADLTVLSADVMTVPEPEILKAQVLYTIVDGRVRYRR